MSEIVQPVADRRWESRKTDERRKLTDQELAQEVSSKKLSLTAHTIGNIRRGRTSPRRQTVRALESYFHCDLSTALLSDVELGPERGLAADHYGGYRVSDYEYLIGAFFFFRRSFDYKGRFICSYVEVRFDDEMNCLCFAEFQENRLLEGETFSYIFDGRIAIAKDTGVLQLRSHLRDGPSVMRRVHNLRINRNNDNIRLLGLLQTLNYNKFKGHYPVVSPVYGVHKGRTSKDEQDEKKGAFGIDDIWDNCPRNLG